MEAIVSQYTDLFTKSNDAERLELQAQLLELRDAHDSEWDLILRLSSCTLQMPLLKIGTDLGIFEHLVKNEKPTHLDDLAKQVGSSPDLLRHLLRASAAFHFIKETGKDEFTANRQTKIFANPNAAGAMVHLYDCHGPVTYALPEYLKERNYRPITSNKDLPFQKALKTDLAPFDWMRQHPEQMKSLGQAMAIERGRQWTESYPVTDRVGTFKPKPESALLVDVGGGFGQQAVDFKTRFPHLPGRIIVQDIPETLSRAPTVEGIEFMVQDFFQPQVIEGAKFYYLRHILHDWADEDCVRILKNLVPALGAESYVVIDEVVFPDTGAPWQAAYMDLAMMSTLGAKERTRSEFESILEEAGLRVIDIHQYDPKTTSVILAVLK
ncbi:S-adenosyl-L-methionine-dependent methyltransferase [Dendryphion nanum]|uniref:S-adenosyl-L-methionine-dependent methyltransferase n=1 Tax=Dendryphion nanum TaxID=256645 RepID=A0A9P9IX43_9PLEO|nr:S-adenosyl-L-methionine-dependent methyltransferase [Dendryphion nanum]